VLIGYGNVGRAFLKLLLEKKDDIRLRYDLDLEIVSVLRSRSGCFCKEGISLPEPAESAWAAGLEFSQVLDLLDPGVMVECVVSSSDTGQPGVGFMRTAFQAGWHVVTADKGPLISFLPELRSSARDRNLRLQISGATAAALPPLDTALISLAGAEIESFEGILNGTTNYILTRIGEGLDFAGALAEAQDKGIAEPDPTLDVEGWDTAYKVLLLTNSLMDQEFGLEDIEVHGITDIPAPMREEAAGTDKSIKLLGRMRADGTDIHMEVRPVILETDHALYPVSGTEKGITFHTDSMGRISVIGGKSDPRGAAAALLKDLINIYR
jgi:homoserine dehydrogenase